MNVIVRLILGALLILVLAACSGSDPVSALEPRTDPFPLRGTYSWTFDIPSYGTQVSTNIFSADQVEYDMAGPAYATHYVIHLESYDTSEGRWIGHTGNEIYYVMFFEALTDTSVSIYKHKCGSRDEAYTFKRPGPDETADHGWNTYLKMEE
ncbi:MAG: hypothetical protein AAGI71_07915 [Bacteroidota bacterium]